MNPTIRMEDKSNFNTRSFWIRSSSLSQSWRVDCMRRRTRRSLDGNDMGTSTIPSWERNRNIDDPLMGTAWEHRLAPKEEEADQQIWPQTLKLFFFYFSSSSLGFVVCHALCCSLCIPTARSLARPLSCCFSPVYSGAHTFVDSAANGDKKQLKEEEAFDMGGGAGRGKFKGKPTGRRHFSTPEEMGMCAEQDFLYPFDLSRFSWLLRCCIPFFMWGLHWCESLVLMLLDLQPPAPRPNLEVSSG